MKEKLVRFDDIGYRLKGVISYVENKEEFKAKHEENIFQEKDERRVEDPGDWITDEVCEEI